MLESAAESGLSRVSFGDFVLGAFLQVARKVSERGKSASRKSSIVKRVRRNCTACVLEMNEY